MEVGDMDGSAQEFRPEVPPAASVPDARGSLDERLWSYHDRYHCGTYADCSACADVWHWETFAGVPDYKSRRGF